MAKTILITGASSGIGRATAFHFQQSGWNVVATMRTPENETELTELDNVLVTRLDVQDSESIRSAVAEAVARFDTIDVLLNNAGYGAYGPLEATPMENVRRQFDVNVIGLLEVTKEVVPLLREQGSGVIINISSIGGKMTFPLGSLYHGSKFAVEGISDALAWELEPLGIKVRIVEPGVINTDFGGRSFNFNNDPSMGDYQPMVSTLMGALGSMPEGSDPHLVAEVIYAAATEDGSQMRYPAGPDAHMLMAARANQDDETFRNTVRSQFGM